ncbi:DUF1697 domain-containing protein [Cyclobacterium plantarum]|uniref:DUF1697 domain-containing protein n=1 Tax=Cyclobacterium plantarum TaxID=2716263 RepID=A0ABX0H0T0_9BACT|nr:DUF1697 domain-containing protein [Cyclobacterium plantarum]NHE55393.1 DUF1697 domain-containing protein [Cyclobacterium plantarum]
MTTYLSILRGINVSAQKLIKMDALKKLYENLNFRDIKTYIQSGNVIFCSAENDPKELERIISSKIETEFGFEVPVIVLNVKTLEIIIGKNPFAKDDLKDSSFLHVTFLADNPMPFSKESILEKKAPAEEIHFTQNAVYLYCPNGYGKTKLNNGFLESKLKVKATTRNWKTVKKLQQLTLEQNEK